MSLEEAKEEVDILYEDYYDKFQHKDPNKKQWYAIQMVTNVIEQRKLNMIEKEKYNLPNIF